MRDAVTYRKSVRSCSWGLGEEVRTAAKVSGREGKRNTSDPECAAGKKWWICSVPSGRTNLMESSVSKILMTERLREEDRK